MEDIIRLQMLEPSDSNAIYRDAKQSYREIYNNAMAKGKGNLEPKFMGGNPIQLDTSNMNSLFNITEGKISIRDYFVSTKADGLRFMLLIGNKNVDGSRSIYLVDSRINFWIITQDIIGNFPSLPLDLNVDKCLLDGELLFWGQISTRKNQHTDQIKEYIIKKDHSQKPLIAFLAFDILYGPTNPEYIIPKDHEITTSVRTFELGGSGAMVGPKAVGRWPTNRRRHVLEQLILNEESPFYAFLHNQSLYNPNRIEYTSNNTIKNQTHYNFTIFVSPFISFKKLLSMKTEDIYPNMKKILQKSIADQYFYTDSLTKKRYKLSLPVISSHDVKTGKGCSADGLIFTPAIESYLQGPWTFCNNKQYKWKPIDQLTVDFEIGSEIGHGYYYGLVRDSNSRSILRYSIDGIEYTSAIRSGITLSKGTIVECSYLSKQSENEAKQNDKVGNNPERYIIFEVKQLRHDKDEPNAKLTALSVLNASDLTGGLSYFKKYTKEPSILDLVVFMTFGNFNGLTGTDKLDILSSFGSEKLTKCLLSKHPELLLKSQKQEIMDMIIQKQSNKTFELEVRIDLGSSNNYSSCLVNNLINGEYTPVPIVKIFDKANRPGTSLRSVYAMIGDTEESLILEETIEKVQKAEMKIKDLLYNYSFGVILSDEIKTENNILHGSKEAGNSEYQNRYTVTNLSNFWRVDIIEYGNAKNVALAKNAWEQSPRTRVEIEYAPASYMDDILKWENPEIIKLLFENTGIKADNYSELRIELMNKLPSYKEKLNNTDPELVLKDLSKVLLTIFNVLDMDLGNKYTERAVERAEKTTKIEKAVEKPVVVEKSSKVEADDLFSRLRKFHNSIKSELIEEVVSHFDNPISLLDISVGKGGDIFKWDKAGIDIVYGIDPDSSSIDEARKRLSTANLKNRDYRFEKLKITDSGISISGKYDIVSCQFTLHYFFESQEMLDRVLTRVSNALKPGGFFIGTTMIRKNVKNLINSNNWPNEIDIVKIDDRSYKMKLKDNTIYTSNLPEYFVDFDQFKEKCKEHSLKLVSTTSFAELYKTYSKGGNKGGGKRDMLRPYEKAVSELNVTFIFIKT